MFNLFKRHNKNYNPIITTTPSADLKNANGVNTLVIAEGCNNDACTELSKKLIGWGSYAGATAIERIKQGKSKHFNTYKCDRFEECRGKCGVYLHTILYFFIFLL